MQADDFFNAYRALSANNEALFAKIEKANSKVKVEDLPASAPSVVCLAFAAELYLKDLHYLLSGKAPKGHNLLKLFRRLPQKAQQQIFDHPSICGNHFIARGPTFSPKKYSRSYSAHEGFTDHIEAMSNGFEKWRYSYESTTLRYETWFVLALIEAIKFISDEERIKQCP